MIFRCKYITLTALEWATKSYQRSLNAFFAILMILGWFAKCSFRLMALLQLAQETTRSSLMTCKSIKEFDLHFGHCISIKSSFIFVYSIQLIKCGPAVHTGKTAGTTINQSLKAIIMDASAYKILAMFTLISRVFLVFIFEFRQRNSELRELIFSDFYTAPIKCGWSMRLTRMAILHQRNLVRTYITYVTPTVSPLATLPRVTNEDGYLALPFYYRDSFLYK